MRFELGEDRQRRSMTVVDVLVRLQAAVEDLNDKRKQLQAQFTESLHRLTAGQIVVGIMLLAAVCGWSFVLQQINRAAHTEERAAVESPRTSWSVKRPGQITKWSDAQVSLSNLAQSYEGASPYDVRSRLVFVGDSITEAWAGTSYGEPIERASGVPEVMEEKVAKRFPRPMVLGISGDQTQHVLWRLSHGELSGAMCADPRLLLVLLIGTNNLAAGHSVEETARGVLAVAERLLNRTHGRVLVNAIFPRGDGMRVLSRLCPPRCDHEGKPLKSFIRDINRLNALVSNSVAKLAQLHKGRVRFVDCGWVFDTRNAFGAAEPTNGGGAPGSVGVGGGWPSRSGSGSGSGRGGPSSVAAVAELATAAAERAISNTIEAGEQYASQLVDEAQQATMRAAGAVARAVVEVMTTSRCLWSSCRTGCIRMRVAINYGQAAW